MDDFKRTLMHGEVTAVTKYDGVGILALGVVAYCTGRVFRRHSEVRFGDVLGLHR